MSKQLLVYKLSGLSTTLSEEMINTYRKNSKPEGFIPQVKADEIKNLLFSTMEKRKQGYKDKIFKSYQGYRVSSTGNTLKNIDEALQFVLLHEGMDSGYTLALLKAIKV